MAISALLGTTVPIIGKVLSKWLKNKGEKNTALFEIEMELRKQETQLIEALVKSDMAQAEINKRYAESKDKYKSYARPTALWICVFGLAWSVFLPVISWVLQIFGVVVPELPQLGSNTLTTLTFGLLGLGAYRSYDKMKGTSK